MRNDGNLYNNDERRQKNRLIYNANRANRRSQDFARHRNPNLFGTISKKFSLEFVKRDNSI